MSTYSNYKFVLIVMMIILRHLHSAEGHLFVYILVALLSFLVLHCPPAMLCVRMNQTVINNHSRPLQHQRQVWGRQWRQDVSTAYVTLIITFILTHNRSDISATAGFRRMATSVIVHANILVSRRLRAIENSVDNYMAPTWFLGIAFPAGID